MKKVAVFALLLISNLVMGQKMKIKKGDFKFLAGLKEVNVEFRYDDLEVLKEHKPEELYVKERTAELNEKNRGSGDIWMKKWESSKHGLWDTNFLDLMTKTVTKEKGTLFQEGLKSARYTLIVDALWIYPGWDASVMKQPAKVTTTLRFVETANRNNVVLEISSDDAPGDQWGSNFSNESRIGEGFEKTGKSLGKMILKEAY